MMVRVVQVIMALVLIAGAVGAWYLHKESTSTEKATVASVSTAINAIRTQIKYEAATGQAQVNGRGHVITINPEWFPDGVPRNELVPPDHPWIEVAAPEEELLTHPRTRVALTKDMAGFWYNPSNGIIRARVAQTVSDQTTLELYNRVNGSAVTELFDSSPR